MSHEYFIKIAKAASENSECKRLQVGCILVKSNNIVSIGYNRFLDNCPKVSVVRDDHEQSTIHAEQAALAFCAKTGTKTDGCTAYITHYPCLICFKMLAASGISNIYYQDDYKNDTLIPKFSSDTKINITKI